MIDMAYSTALPVLEVSATFAINGAAIEAVPIKTGHINDTFFIRDSCDKRYVLQRINGHVFSDAKSLVRNIQLTTDYLRVKLQAAGTTDIDRRVLQLIPQRIGGWLAEAPRGQYWRMYRFVDRAYSVKSEPSLERVLKVRIGC